MSDEHRRRRTDGDIDDTSSARCATYAVIGTMIAAAGYYLSGQEVTHAFVAVVLTSLFAFLLAATSWRERRKGAAERRRP